jgi:hypothetical protein
VAEKDPYDLAQSADAVQLVVRAVENCERRYHDAFIEKVERRYDAYRGLAESQEDDRQPADWHSEITTPYVLQTVEGMLATMLEPNPRCTVKPRPHPEEPLELVVGRMTKANVLEDVIAYCFERDHFAAKQRDFMQQDLIAGLTVLKDYWMYEKRDVTRMQQTTIDVYDADGVVVDSLYGMEEATANQVTRDDACSEVRDVRDFFWPSQAPNVEKAEYLIDRTWESFSSCKRKEKLGHYQNVDKLKDSTRGSTLNANVTAREQRLRNVDRTQDLVEILEYWTPERVITVGNRTVKLNDRPNPLWNGRMPFIVCSAMPDAFQVPGISVVEALGQLQEMLWTLQNQRLDVLRMVANLITLIRSDVDDPEAFEWAPNAQWLVEDPDQVKQLPVDPTVASITLQAEALLKGDLQNIMGGLPYAGGTDSQTIDQQTATGVSIITSIAQRIIQARKQHYLWSYARLGKHYLQLWQQFVRDDRVIKIVGAKGAEAYRAVSPMDLQGDFDVTIDITSDSLLRQERRAEAQSLLQVAAATAPVSAQLGAPLNMKAFWEKVLDSFDVTDKERYFLPQQAAAAVGAGMGPPGAPPGTPPPGQGAGGITNPELAAGPSSPSNGNSMSPEAAMQQLMAMRGQPAGG